MATDEKLLGEGSRTKRSPLLWVVALSGCVLGGASLVQHQFFANDRFYFIQGKDGAVNEIDRRTGRTWRIYGLHKSEIKSPDDAVPMPLSLHKKIVGKVVKHYSYKLSIEFYNGTEWDISEVTIGVLDTPDSRLFREAEPIKPFSKGIITFDCDSEGIGQSDCVFVEFLGHPPNRP